MQLPQVAVRGPAPLAASPAPGSYGFGLFIDEDPVWGRIVVHSGGYPGFGSNMRWHPATGIGVIALGNSTYAPVSQLAARLLITVLGQRARRLAGQGAGRGGHGYQGGSPHAERALALAPAPAPWPATVAAREEIGQLMESWDDAAAAKLFSDNVALDQPLAERRRRVGLIRERLGGLHEGHQPPGRIRHARALPLVGGGRSRHRPGRDPAHAAAAAPGPVVHSGRTARDRVAAGQRRGWPDSFH